MKSVDIRKYTCRHGKGKSRWVFVTWYYRDAIGGRIPYSDDEDYIFAVELSSNRMRTWQRLSAIAMNKRSLGTSHRKSKKQDRIDAAMDLAKNIFEYLPGYYDTDWLDKDPDYSGTFVSDRKLTCRCCGKPINLDGTWFCSDLCQKKALRAAKKEGKRVFEKLAKQQPEIPEDSIC